MRLRKSHVERFLDGKSGIWERLTTDKTSLSIFTADETFRFLRDDSTAVIRGWGAVHLLKNVPHVVRVRICAPLETRIARMMERLGTDNREAVENEDRFIDLVGLTGFEDRPIGTLSGGQMQRVAFAEVVGRFTLVGVSVRGQHRLGQVRRPPVRLPHHHLSQECVLAIWSTCVSRLGRTTAECAESGSHAAWTMP